MASPDEVKEIKGAIEKIGSAWEESKKANDELIAKQSMLEGGQAEIKVKQDKIDADLNAALELKASLEKLSAQVARMNAGQEEVKKDMSSPEYKNFAHAFKLMAKGKAGSQINLGMLGADEQKAMSAHIDPDGGYTITNVMGMMKTRQFDTSPVRSLASVITIGGSEYPFLIDDDEMDVSNSSETGTRSATGTAQFGLGSIPVHEYYADIPLTSKILEDSGIDLFAWASQKAMDKFSRSEAADFVTGDGINKCKGFTAETVKTSSPRVYARGQVGTLTAASATAITADELITLRGYLKAYYRPNASWAFNSLTETYIRKLKDGQNNYLWQPSYQIGEAQTLLGQRVALCEDMPDIASTAISVVLADFRECYQIVDRLGVSLIDDPYTTKGQRNLFFRRRVGGGVCQWDGIKYLKQNA
jgi:HK97 family phage major capsid protein